MGKIKKKGKGVNTEFSSHPPRRITWGSGIATGYDRLKVGLYVIWDDLSLIETLSLAKEQAKDNEDTELVSLSPHGDMVFNCHSTGRRGGGYGYHISRADVHIFFSTTKNIHTPNVWIDIGSASCWAPGYKTVIDEIKNLIRLHRGRLRRKSTISEVHLCADTIDLDLKDLNIHKSEYWITRANKFAAFSDRHQLTGITLSQNYDTLPRGSRETLSVQRTGIHVGQGDLMLRVYDKTLELKRSESKQSLFASVWGKKNFDDVKVVRTEFQVRRKVLKQMHINSLEDLEDKKTGLWRYCTELWARLSINLVDRNNRHQDRAVIHPWWEKIQKLDFSQIFKPVVRQKVQPSKDIRVLQDMMSGCALTIGTILNRKHDDIESVITFGQAYLESRIRTMWKEKTLTGKNLFKHKMKKRWAEVWPLGFESSPI